MEFNFRSLDKRSPPPLPSTLGYFSQHPHALRGSLFSFLLRLRNHNKKKKKTFFILISPLFFSLVLILLTNPIQFHLLLTFLHLSTATQQTQTAPMIERQLEKEKIREEIMAAERRRLLEAEVRRELMVERDIAMRRAAAADGLAFDHHPRLLHHPLDHDRFATSLINNHNLIPLVSVSRRISTCSFFFWIYFNFNLYLHCISFWWWDIETQYKVYIGLLGLVVLLLVDRHFKSQFQWSILVIYYLDCVFLHKFTMTFCYS